MALTQLTKIDGGGISTTSDYRVGVITATKFIGPFEGSTGTFSGNITAVDGTFSGNVTVGGTLTYEDVTNIDSVGILTARAGIFIDDSITHIGDTNTKIRFPAADTITAETGGSERLRITSTGKVGIGTTASAGQSLQVHHATADEVVRISSGDATACLTFKDSATTSNRPTIGGKTDDLFFQTGGSEKVRITSAGRVGINSTASNTRLDVIESSASRTWTPGSSVVSMFERNGNSIISLVGGTGSVVGFDFADSNDNNVGYILYDHSDNSMAFRTATEERLRITSTGSVGIGTDVPDTLLHLHGADATQKLLTLSSGPEKRNNYIGVSGQDNLEIAVDEDNGGGSSSIRFRIDGNEKARIKSNGNVGIGTDNPTQLLHLGADSAHKILLKRGGASPSEVTFGNEGNYAIISNNTNGIELRTGSTPSIAMHIDQSGKVGIGTDNPTEILDVRGDLVVAESIAVNRPRIVLSAPNDGTNFRHLFGANLQVNSSGTFTTPTANISGGGWEYLPANSLNAHGSIRYLSAPDTNATSSTPLERLKIDSSGHILPGAAGTQDLGSTSKEFRNLYIGDDGKVQLGSDQDFTIQHDGSHLYLDTGTGLFYSDATNHILRNKAGTQDVAKFAEGASGCMLYCSNGVKLTTTTTGITVGGEVAASQDYPNQRPSVDFNFVSVKKLDPRFTFRRIGPASYTDEFGKVVLVGGNTPRFDHNPTTRECKGLLIEESRTNYVRQSLTLATDWDAGGGSYGYDAAITNPDGSVGAYYHTGAELYHQNIDLSGASTNVVIVSMWVKERSGHTGVMDIEMFQQISGGAVSMGAFTVNPITGTITTGGARWSDGTVTEYPNGWYRFSAKATTASGNFTSSTRLDLQNNEHYVWGVQVEVGSFVTSFIPTRGSTATRGQGFAVIDGEELSDFYNPNASTVICQFDASNWVTYNPSKYDRVWSFGNHNTETDTIEMFKQNSSNSAVRWRIRTSNTNVLGASNYTYSTTRPKLGFAWQLNDAGVSIDGGTVAGTGDSGIPLPSITKLSLGNSGIENNSGDHGLTGWIRRFTYYPIKVSDAQLVTLTS